jgi:predicted transcriptional regulator
MTGKKSPGKPRPRITDQQISDMMRLRRQGKSISAIARALKCNRQTVRVYLKERQADILTGEVRRQVLTDELQKHLNDLTEFAVSFKSYVTRPNSLGEDGDATTVFKPLLGEDLPQGLDSGSQKVRREQRQINRRNRMLLKSLREHTRGQGWWAAYEEWQEVWNTCRNATQELQGEADKVVENHINEKPSLKGEVERRIKEERDTVGKIKSDVLSVVWLACTSGKPVDKYKFRVKEDRVVAVLADGSYLSIGHRLSEVSLGPDMAEVCKLSFETLYQSFIDKGIPEMLHRVDEKIEVIDDALDPFILRPLLVRTRCELCPV